MSLFVFPPVSLSIASSPITFKENAVTTTVLKDTSTPSNSKPLPVEQLKSDGTVLDPATETKQDAVIAALGTLNSKDFATSAKQDSSITQLTNLNAKDFATQTTLAAVLAKLSADPSTATKQDSVISGLASILAKLIAAPSTEAKQDSVITVLGNILADLQLKVDKTETQPVSAVSLPLPSGAATEAKQDTIISAFSTLNSKDFATQTTLAAILAKIIAAPSTEAKQDSIITALNTIIADKNNLSIVDTVPLMNVSSTIIKASSNTAGTEIVSSTSGAIKKIQTIEDVGEFMGLYSGADGSLTFICALPIAGGEVEVNIPASTRLSIKNLKDATISTNTFFTANLLG